MTSLLALLLLVSLACQNALCCTSCEGHALKCHMCVASNEEDCNQQGSASCPQYADACTTITGPNTVMKSCSYKAFCEKAHGSTSGSKMECCFTEDCNGPQPKHKGHNHWDRNDAGAMASSPGLLLGALVLRLALNWS